MYITSQCNGCIKPVGNRLAFFGTKDEYECYSESYVKCFWGLCDQHKSNENITQKHVSKVVTTQPSQQVINKMDQKYYNFIKNK